MPTINVDKSTVKSLEADGRLGTIAVIDDDFYSYQGQVLKRKRHRRVITLDDDISSEPQVIQNIQTALVAANPGVEQRWADSKTEG